MKRASVADVALLAGVSTATVSRVINAPDKVSEGTRKKVLEAVDELNFVKSAAGFSLKVQHTYNVLVIVASVGNTYYSDIFEGLQVEAEAHGYSIIITSPSPEDVSGQITNRLRSGRVDGVIVLHGADLSDADFELLKFVFHGTPPVVGFAEKKGLLRYPHIYIDNRKAAYTATQHLIEAGHRKIAHMMGPEQYPVSGERLAGFTDALKDAGLTLDPKDIYPTGFHRDGGRRVARQFARRTIRPTAMVCCNDETAMGFISELQILGISVPDDVSVVGFDNMTVADVYVPALTTISQPRGEIGARSMGLLLDLMRDPTISANRVIELEVRLAKRASVARPKPQSS